MQNKVWLFCFASAACLAAAWSSGALPGTDRSRSGSPGAESDGNTDTSGGAAAIGTDSIRVLPVQLQTLTAVTRIDRPLRFTGTLVAARRSALAFERGGRLDTVLVDQGDRVSAGQPLAVLDQRQLLLRIEELRARHAQQLAVLEELTAGPRPETIAAAKAELQALTSESGLRQATYRRTQELFDRGASGEQTLDEAMFSWQATDGRRQAAARRLDELLAGTRKEQLAAQSAAVAVLSTQLEQLQTDLADSTLVAPYAGRIIRRIVDEGSMLNAQQPVLELLESNRLEARIGVPAGLAQRFQRGDRFTLTVTGSRTGLRSADSIRDTNHQGDQRLISAVLRDTLPQIDAATRTQSVILDVDDPDIEGLSDGELVQWEIRDSVPVEGFRVPLSALSTGARGLWVLYVMEESATETDPQPRQDHSDIAADGNTVFRVRSRPVEILLTDEDFAVIRGAISAGEKFAVSGSHRLVNGQLVRPASSDGADRKSVAAGSFDSVQER